jgi:predicted regulator of Ras-like GTPase activity (Roadblock/LC7/MglB family)
MTFETILQSIVDDCGGGLSAALMGLDGIAIEQVVATPGTHDQDPLAGDVTHAGIEFGRILADAVNASDSLGTGGVKEAVFSLDAASLIFHMVDNELMLVPALHPDGNLGKARYLLRRSIGAIRAEL